MGLEVVEIGIAIGGVFCAIIGALIAFIMNGILGSMREMSKNIVLLNEKMVVIIERVDGHEGRIIRLEDKKGE